MNKTNIEYLTHTWNPIVMRCTPCSPGCLNCWHLAMCERMKENPSIPEWKRVIYAGKEGPNFSLDEMNQPLKKVKPARIGVQFMGDLFHESIEDRVRDLVFDRIFYDGISHLTFIILTKRPGKMLDYIIREEFRGFSLFSNVWFGVTAENQTFFDFRWSILRLIPCKTRVISVEPMLGPVDIRQSIGPKPNWVICGCESGHGARETKIEWVRDLKNQCVDAGIPFFLKQLANPEYKDSRLSKKLIKMPELDGRVWDQTPTNYK